MGRFEVMGIDSATLGEANAAEDVFFQLGMMYSTGSTVSADYVSAHKWFNLAAMRGNKDATRLRREMRRLLGGGRRSGWLRDRGQA